MASNPFPPPLVLLWVSRVHYPVSHALPLHRHQDFSQLFLVLDGTGSFQVGRAEKTFATGAVFYARPGAPHGFSAARGGKVMTLEAKFEVRDPGLARLLSADVAFTDEGGACRLLLESIVREGARGEAHHREIATTRLTELLWLLLRNRARRELPAGKPADGRAARARRGASAGGRNLALSIAFDPLARRVADFLEARYREPFSLARTAAAVGFSPRHVSGRFRQVTGETVAAWLWRLRVEHSKKRMLAGDDPLEAIALQGGFETVHHFSRIFKQIEGVPPGQWREWEREGISRGVGFGGFKYQKPRGRGKAAR